MDSYTTVDHGQDKVKQKVYKAFLSSFHVVLGFYYLILTAIFTLNFIGSPLLIYVYMIQIAFAVVMVYIFPLKNSITILIGLLFTEGQIRVLFNYHPAIRVFFDLLICAAILKSIIGTKVMFPKNKIPSFIGTMIFFHFCWYFIEIFNPNSVGMIGVLAGAKLYIYPIFMFFAFLANPIDLDSKEFQQFFLLVIIITLAEHALCIYQMSQGFEHLLDISPNYMSRKSVFKFVGERYRSWGTSNFPANISVHISEMVGLFFIVKLKTGFKKLLVLLTILLGAYVLFILQVRSSMVKYFIIILGSLFFAISCNRSRLRAGANFALIAALVALFIAPNMESILEMTGEDINYKQSLSKLSSFFDTKNLKTNRLRLGEFIDIASKKLTEFPIGLAPGRSGPIVSLSMAEIERDPLFNIGHGWNHENMIISLIIDFGIGFIFLFSIFIFMPFVCLAMSIKSYLKKEMETARTLGICFVSVFSIILSNWGAPGILYNPESFLFWFWCAIAFNTYFKKFGGFHKDSYIYETITPRKKSKNSVKAKELFVNSK